MNAQVVNLNVNAQPGAAATARPAVAGSGVPGLRDRLAATSLLSGREFARVERLCAESDDDRSVVATLAELGLVAERDLAEAIAAVTGHRLAGDLDYGDLAAGPEPVSARFLREHGVFPAGIDKGRLELVMADPADAFAIEAMALAFDCPVVPVIGVRGDIELAIDTACGAGGPARDEQADADDADELSAFDVDQLRDMASEAPVIRLVNLLLKRAFDAQASDIHIEPFEGELKLRYRIDGVLHETEAPPPKLAPAVISRIKIMAKLDIAERRLPQDGRIKLRLQGRDIDARVSTIPTMHGESVVMRLLNRGDVSLDLDSLGFAGAARQRLLDVLDMPNGMLLVTGPTGSGKTTTLYTAIHILNTESRKIITAEDPVEYQMQGVNQIQVKPAIGLTFANVLRSIVRQDPDVILVGEMRDLETARICVQSALTGHLVLSTLHTNSAASSVTRLLEMGIEDYLLASTLNAIVSQRLVRVLCEHCREPYPVPPELAAELDLGRFTDDTDGAVLYRAVGCEHCNGTGYHGRHAIVELLVLDDDVRKLILARSGAREIEAAAARNGFRSIFEDGMRKALAGLTTLEEVTRVTQEA